VIFLNNNNYILKSNINNNILDEFFKNTVMAYDSYTIDIDNKIFDNNENYESLITKLKNLLTPVKTGGLKNKTKKNEKQYSGGFNLGLSGFNLGLKRTARNISNTVVRENPLYDFLNQIFFKTACYINEKIINDMKELLNNSKTNEIASKTNEIAVNVGYKSSEPYIYLFIFKTIRKTLSLRKSFYLRKLRKKFNKLSELIESIVNGEKNYVNNNSINEDKITEFLQ